MSSQLMQQKQSTDLCCFSWHTFTYTNSVSATCAKMPSESNISECIRKQKKMYVQTLNVKACKIMLHIVCSRCGVLM